MQSGRHSAVKSLLPLIMRIFILLFGCIMALHFSASAQQRRQKPVTFQKHYNEVLPKAPQYKLSGWLFAPGATYMLTPFIGRKESWDESATQRYDGRFTPLGKPGIYAEVGRYRMLPYGRFFKYFDYGISYKSLRGREKAEGERVIIPEETVLLNETAEGQFGYHYAEAFVNFNHIWRIGKYNFIQHSVGANAGYGFIRNMSGGTLSPATVEEPGNYLAQLHYKLGYGIKMRGNWLIIPSIETPVLNLLPFEAPRSSLGFFTSRYRPLIFSVRIFLMRPADGMDCTPVRTREGLFMPTDIDKQQQMNETK